MSAKDLISGIRDFVRQLEEEEETAFDLWSWLPSKKVAEMYHGDNYSNHRPPPADVMREASMVLAEASGYRQTDNDRKEWFETCPCGQDHDGEPLKDNSMS